MAAQQVMPWQLLAYDPAAPNLDTLVREACMQVDPCRWRRFRIGFASTRNVLSILPKSSLSPCPLSISRAGSGSRTIAPGVRDFGRVSTMPRELEIELTGRRLTAPPGSVPALIREGRGHLDPGHWERFFAGQHFPDDLLLTFAGDGDAALYPDLIRILKAARQAGPLSICVQTDLAAENIDTLLLAIAEGLIDILTIPMYGHTRAIYDAVAKASVYETVMANFKTLAAATSAAGGVPLVIPRLLKVRQTIPELEPFFDSWIRQAGWSVLESPTDRAGAIAFEAVVDMGPSKRRPCRRLWDRLLIRANGVAVACDQDVHDRLSLGHIESHSLDQLWNGESAQALREQHADGRTATLIPCNTCREWYRP